jgi:hypothetical protein
VTDAWVNPLSTGSVTAPDGTVYRPRRGDAVVDRRRGREVLRRAGSRLATFENGELRWVDTDPHAAFEDLVGRAGGEWQLSEWVAETEKGRLLLAEWMC